MGPPRRNQGNLQTKIRQMRQKMPSKNIKSIRTYFAKKIAGLLLLGLRSKLLKRSSKESLRNSLRKRSYLFKMEYAGVSSPEDRWGLWWLDSILPSTATVLVVGGASANDVSSKGTTSMAWVVGRLLDIPVFLPNTIMMCAAARIKVGRCDGLLVHSLTSGLPQTREHLHPTESFSLDGVRKDPDTHWPTLVNTSGFIDKDSGLRFRPSVWAYIRISE